MDWSLATVSACISIDQKNPDEMTAGAETSEIAGQMHRMCSNTQLPIVMMVFISAQINIPCNGRQNLSGKSKWVSAEQNWHFLE